MLDRRAALICAVFANCFRDPKRRPFQVEDFMPRSEAAGGRPVAKLSPDEKLAQLRMWNAAMGGKEVVLNG